MTPRLLGLVLVVLAAGCSGPTTHVELETREPIPADPVLLRPGDSTRAPAPAAFDSANVPAATTLSGRSVIGRSVDGLPIEAIDFGTGPSRLYLIGLIHGNESEGFGAIDEVETALRTASRLSGVRVRLVPSMNPDGFTKRRRSNAKSVDLNRNWPASNFSPSRSRGRTAASEPEVRAVLADIEAFEPDALIVFHSISRRGPFVNFDGPELAGRLAEAFAGEARRAGGGRWSVVPDMGYKTPGSLGTWAGIERRIPTLTIEFRSNQDAAEAERAAVAGVRAVAERLR